MPALHALYIISQLKALQKEIKLHGYYAIKLQMYWDRNQSENANKSYKFAQT